MQVLERIAGERQLGEQDERRAVLGRFGVQARDLPGVGRRIGQRHARDGDRQPREILSVQVEEAPFSRDHAGRRRLLEAAGLYPLSRRRRKEKSVRSARPREIGEVSARSVGEPDPVVVPESL